MTTPKDLVPNKYEVIKLTTGQEIVGMTREVGDEGLEVYLPMICHLTVQVSVNTTLATFYPYAPLSSEPNIMIPWDVVIHRSRLNEQFINLYDGASTQWLTMLENKSIPLAKTSPDQIGRDFKETIDAKIKSVVSQLSEQDPIEFEEFLEREFPLTEEEEFKFAIPPKDKKKFH
tara:strand:- start:698 stop:1219 length:522 start_codon:yes stop_codon:yes gene_type:complete